MGVYLLRFSMARLMSSFLVSDDFITKITPSLMVDTNDASVNRPTGGVSIKT